MKYTKLLLMGMILISSATYAQNDEVMRAFENPSVEELGNQNGRPGIGTFNEVDKMSNIDMTIYPNPARNGNSTITMKNLKSGEKKIKIDIVDAYGNNLRSELIITSETALEHPLSTNSTMKPGIYSVIVTTGRQTVRNQWVVE